MIKRTHLLCINLMFIILMFSGCGAVERTLHPTIIFTSTLHLNRIIKIYGPDDAKVYFSINKSEPILKSIIINGYTEIKLNKTTQNTGSNSTWKKELIAWSKGIVQKAESQADEDLIILVKKNDKLIFTKKVEHFWGFYYGYYSTFEEIQKWDIVESAFANLIYRNDSKYNQEEVLNINYRDLVLEIK